MSESSPQQARAFPRWYWAWVAIVAAQAGMLLWMSGLIILMRWRMTNLDRTLFFVDAVGLCVLLPLGVLMKRKWDRNHPITGSGTCRQCGYDLRASAKRCPECGLVIDRDQAQKS